MEERKCTNCRYYLIVGGKPLCFAIQGKQGRPIPRGVQPQNKCHNGRFATRQTAEAMKQKLEKK